MVTRYSNALPSIALYLDIDGVLHHEQVLWSARKGIYMCPKLAPGRQLFEWEHYLTEALAPFPQVQLVLSSSWCRKPGFGKTMKRLSPALRDRFVGGTFHWRVHGADFWSLKQFEELPRGIQVLRDVERRKPLTWLALDDDAEGWPEVALDNLVRCNGTSGLSAPSVREELHAKLERCKESALGSAGET